MEILEQMVIVHYAQGLYKGGIIEQKLINDLKYLIKFDLKAAILQRRQLDSGAHELVVVGLGDVLDGLAGPDGRRRQDGCDIPKGLALYN